MPSIERGTSSELQNNNNSTTSIDYSREGDRLNWSILSPPPPNYLQLPNCPICLRRILNRISHIEDETNERDRDKLIIGPAFIGHGDRCRVCHIFSDSSSQVILFYCYLNNSKLWIHCVNLFSQYIVSILS